MVYDAKALATCMIKMYGKEAEPETRKYALVLKSAGQKREYALWVQAADLIARRQKLLRSLDA